MGFIGDRMMPIDMNTEKTTPSEHYPGAVRAQHDPEDIPELEPAPRQASAGVWIVVVVGIVFVVGVIVYGLLARAAAERRLEQVTKASAVPTVNVIHPAVTGVGAEISLPGNTQAFNDTPIYARTSGYLKQWFVDIGQHVTKGQLMATIETPELDEQLQVSQANLKSAQADLALANTTSQRYQNLLKSDSVSKQETDVAVSGATARQAAVDAAEAGVRRLQQLQSFEKVYAPYSGVVTTRNTDIGDLIDSGSPTSSGNAKELFRIASVDKLRVYVAVPETYAPAIRDGNTATLTLDEYPGQQFVGKIARNSNAIDQASRTLNVEVDVDNADGKLLPGAYAFVHFKIPEQVQMLSVPANALLFRAQGLQVGLVRDGVVHLQTVTIGKDNGSSLEIATGLKAEDQVILDPSDSIAEGQRVQVSDHSQGQRTVTR
jgi:RND family efflux transporter MFP subunit